MRLCAKTFCSRLRCSHGCFTTFEELYGAVFFVSHPHIGPESNGRKKEASHWVCACVWGSSGSGLTVKTSDSQHGDRGSSPVRGTFFLFTFFVPLTLCCELNVYNRWFCTCVTRSRSGLTVKTSDSQHEDRGSSPVLGTFFFLRSSFRKD